jgi:6-pyruvoyltetrahydropterin/6-carboxytetrahydropterin synthase
MYTLTVKVTFEAAHMLPAVGGGCEELHSHTYKAAISVEADSLDETGVAVDFRTLKGVLTETIKPLVHTLLNEVPPFDRLPPSAENVARFVFDESSRRLKETAQRVKLKTATVWESETASATYEESQTAEPGAHLECRVPSQGK